MSTTWNGVNIKEIWEDMTMSWSDAPRTWNSIFREITKNTTTFNGILKNSAAFTEISKNSTLFSGTAKNSTVFIGVNKN